MSEEQPKKGGAPPGNDYGTKLKEPEVRQEAFKQYCAHLASGYPKEAFFFDHPTHSVCWKTMDRYIHESPEEFPTILINKAKSARYKHWLEEGRLLMRGKYKNGSPVVWQTCMRNIFKELAWDKFDTQKEVSQEAASTFDALMAMFRGAQDASRKMDSNNNISE